MTTTKNIETYMNRILSFLGIFLVVLACCSAQEKQYTVDVSGKYPYSDLVCLKFQMNGFLNLGYNTRQLKPDIFPISSPSRRSINCTDSTFFKPNAKQDVIIEWRHGNKSHPKAYSLFKLHFTFVWQEDSYRIHKVDFNYNMNKSQYHHLKYEKQHVVNKFKEGLFKTPNHYSFACTHFNMRIDDYWKINITDLKFQAFMDIKDAGRFGPEMKCEEHDRRTSAATVMLGLGWLATILIISLTVSGIL